MATTEELEQIRSRLNLVEIVSQYVAVRPSGANYIACCPFHEDKTPSMTINREKGLFHCFGCGVGGDLFQFVMKIERLSFPEAVARLAAQAGVPLRSRERSGEPDSERAQLLNLNERVAQIYERNLRSPQGKQSMAYLAEERKLKPETIKRFRLGYALPAWDQLVRTFPNEQTRLQKLGLILPGRSGQSYDRLRARATFPITSVQGEVIGFAGRTLPSGEQEPKYLNIPNTPLFEKGGQLYGLSWALSTLNSRSEAWLVEGYLDVITLHQVGFTGAVASMGTALTAGQAKLLKRYVERVCIIYDRDTAGRTATLRGMRQLLAAGLEVQVALLPPGRDPDSLVRQEGPEVLSAVIAQGEPFHEFYLTTLFEDHDGRGVRGQEEILAEAQRFISGLTSLPLRYQMIRELAARLDLPREEVEQQMVKGGNSPRIMASTEHRGGGKREPERRDAEESLLYFTLQGDLPVRQLMELFTPPDFGRYGEIFAALFDLYREGGEPERLSEASGSALLQRWLEQLDADNQARLRALSLSERRDADPQRAIIQLLQSVRLRRAQGRLRALQQQISQAEHSGNRQIVEDLQREQRQLSREQAQLLSEIGWRGNPVRPQLTRGGGSRHG
jgi:DNA primase